MTAAGDAVAAYAAALSRLPAPTPGTPLLDPPPDPPDPPPGTTVAVDADAGVAVLTPPVGVLVAAFDALGTPTEGAPVPATSAPLVPLRYPSGPPAVVVAYRGAAGLVAAVAVRWPAHGAAGDLRLDPASGRLTGAAPYRRPGHDPLRRRRLGRAWADMRTGWAHLVLRHEVPGGGWWAVTLRYDGPRLASLSLAHAAAGESVGWDSWSAEREQAARDRHDAWLAGQFGGQPGHGQPGQQRGRHSDERSGGHPGRGRYDPARPFPWGEVWSGYDERSACSSVVVSYVS